MKRGTLWLALLVGAVGCDGASSGSDAAVPAPTVDAGAIGSDAGPPPPAPDAGPPPPADAGPAPAGGGALTGHVTRTAEPAAGGRGHLYIAVFTSDPVTDRAGAMNVAQLRVEDVDMSAASASVPYTLTGIPPRAEPYYVTAFLDDNGTVSATDPERAGPDRGDLVALDGFASPSVTVASEATVTLDLVLSFNLPF